MTTQLEFQARSSGRSQNHKLADYLRANPGRWLPMPELAQVITPTGIGAAVHSRIADLRKLGLTIEHRNEKNHHDGLVHSFYKYIPNPSHSPAHTLTHSQTT